MTPKEKANELFERFNKEGLHQISSVINRFIRKEIIKQCALIAVGEMLNEYTGQCPKDSWEMERHLYWIEVKQEIEKL